MKRTRLLVDIVSVARGLECWKTDCNPCNTPHEPKELNTEQLPSSKNQLKVEWFDKSANFSSSICSIRVSTQYHFRVVCARILHQGVRFIGEVRFCPAVSSGRVPKQLAFPEPPTRYAVNVISSLITHFQTPHSFRSLFLGIGSGSRSGSGSRIVSFFHLSDGRVRRVTSNKSHSSCEI